MMDISRVRLRCVLLLILVAAVDTLYGQSFYHAYQPGSSYCRDAAETADGGFVLVGGIDSAEMLFFLRTDANGFVVWTAHQQLNGARGVAVCRASDGGFAVLGENYDDGSGLRRSIVLKTDSLGIVQWQRELAYPAMSNGFVDIVATPGGGFALLGSAVTLGPVPDWHLRLLQLDAAGNEVWSQILGDPDSGKEIPVGLVALPNGDLAVAAERRDAPSVLGGSDFLLARTDANGNLLWQTEYNKPGYQVAHDFKVDQNGHFVLLGETRQTDPVTMTILKTDGSGAEIWCNNLLNLFSSLEPNIPFRTLSCLALDPAGNMYIPYREQDFVEPTAMVSVLRLNPAGDPVWVKPTSLTDIFATGLYTADQHFVFSGQTNWLPEPERASLWKTDWTGDGVFLSVLFGSVFWDQNLNCDPDADEPAPPTFIVEAKHTSGNTYYRQTNAAGQYSFWLPALGEYTLTARPYVGVSALWQVCDTPTVQVVTTDSATHAPPIGVQSLVDCPYLDVDLHVGLLRRCTTANYYLQYCNRGTQTAVDAAVQVVLDPLMSYEDSSIPLAGQSGDTLFFDLGEVAPGDCGSFSIRVLVSCAAVQGQTLCASAYIFPDSSCVPPDPSWDGSHLVVSAECNGSAQFTIGNIGIGDMTGPVEYVIIEDQIMYQNGTLQLNAGADTVIAVPDPAGYSYLVRVAQRPGHPGGGQPAAAADGCNGESLGESLALQFPVGDGGGHSDTRCSSIIGSYDPNDKRGFPLGWRDEHYLEIGQDVEYMIRFQNTGNDTAFLVVIRDTLPPALDPATVRPGAASHPYTFQLAGGNNTLVFTFANILLPDSTTNEPASNGFVTFRVSQRPGLALGAVIENRAAIYFDFNDPVITDPYFHTVGRPLLTFVPEPPTPDALELLVFPNPASDYADFRIGNSKGRYRFRLFNLSGQTLHDTFFSGETYRFHRNGLAPGVYFFRLENEAGKAAAGKIILGK